MSTRSHTRMKCCYEADYVVIITCELRLLGILKILQCLALQSVVLGPEINITMAAAQNLSPIPDLLNQDLCFNKARRCFTRALKLEERWRRTHFSLPSELTPEALAGWYVNKCCRLWLGSSICQNITQHGVARLVI